MGEQEPSGGDAGPLQQQAANVKEQVQQAAADLKDQVAERATGALAGRQEAAIAQLGSVAHAFRQTGQELRERDQAGIAGYLDRATGQVERLADFLRNRDARELVGEAERFARREPTLFLGGMFAAGLLAARFLKSSGQVSHGGGGTGRRDGEERLNEAQVTAIRDAIRTMASRWGQPTGRDFWDRFDAAGTDDSPLAYRAMHEQFRLLLASKLRDGALEALNRCTGPTGEGLGGAPIGAAEYHPSLAQRGQLRLASGDPPWDFTFGDPTSPRFRGTARLASGEAVPDPAAIADLDEFVCATTQGSEGRIYVPGQTGYHAWHQGLGDRGYCLAGCHIGTGGVCEPGPPTYLGLDAVGALDAAAAAHLATLLGVAGGGTVNPAQASERFRELAVDAARRHIKAGVAQIAVVVLLGDDGHAEPAQYNIDWVQFRHGHPHVVRAAIDVSSCRLYNWMVLSGKPTEGTLQKRMRRVAFYGDPGLDRSRFNAFYSGQGALNKGWVMLTKRWEPWSYQSVA